MTADLQAKAYETKAALYIPLELSNEKWRLAFGEGTRSRQVSIAAGGMGALSEQIGKAKAKWTFAKYIQVVSCYEAGLIREWERLQVVQGCAGGWRRHRWQVISSTRATARDVLWTTRPEPRSRPPLSVD